MCNNLLWLKRSLKISSVLVLGLMTVKLILSYLLVCGVLYDFILFSDIPVLFFDDTTQIISLQISVRWCRQTTNVLFEMTFRRTSLTATSVLVKLFIAENNWKLVLCICINHIAPPLSFTHIQSFQCSKINWEFLCLSEMFPQLYWVKICETKNVCIEEMF